VGDREVQRPASNGIPASMAHSISVELRRHPCDGARRIGRKPATPPIRAAMVVRGFIVLVSS
jgi:hypothetical protein